MPETITTVGGGLAGLALGIGLRQRGVPVTLWEAGAYPRHRVCGEFISGQGQEVLARLGLLGLLEKAGARPAVDAAFFCGRSSVPSRPLPQPALCLSRFVLDSLLAEELVRLGGKLKPGERWRGAYGPGIVRASGRQIEPVVEGYRWIGLKAHARNVVPSADLELHFLASGYVGLCRLPGEIFNVCGLFRTETTVPDLGTTWRQWLTGPEGSPLHERLAPAQFEENSFCSVAGLDLRPRNARTIAQCCIGDALTMIPPMTGNGMSMALESAEMALDPLAEYSRGKLSWTEAQAQIAQACDARFRRRLRWATRLQRLLMVPAARNMLMRFTAHFEGLGRALFRLTR
ncbi:MAG: hypothetical protein NTZ46_11525 [Verrucomicrobia bacterium]|nr:hypothetical protein [Verrucomicrobiota bacterium]